MFNSLQAFSTPHPIDETSGLPSPVRKHAGVRTVLVDADDTLWENNVFFLQSIEWLCGVGRSLGHTDSATINILNHWETFNIARLGFGYHSYAQSFYMVIRALVARSGKTSLHAGLRARAATWIRFLESHPIVWLPGVEDTIPQLTKRFCTIIVTKGAFKDQMGKVDRCGLKHLFHAAEVVPDKKPANYQAVIRKYGLDPDSTVMVGNSPRSDINMPRLAGLRTVYIPHANSWFREVEPIERHAPYTIEITSFHGLLDVLAS